VRYSRINSNRKSTTTVALAVAAVLALSALLVPGGTQQSFATTSVNLKGNGIVQHVNNDATLTIDTIQLHIKKKNANTDGNITVGILQDGQTLASDTLSTDDLGKKNKFKRVTADFDDVQVTGDFDVKVSFDGKGGVKVQTKKASADSIFGDLTGVNAPENWVLKLKINAEESSGGTSSPPPTTPPPSPTPPPEEQLTGKITVYNYRIPSEFWAPTFVEANAQMYFVVYNSSGYIVANGFSDENGNTITGLQSGVTYWISPTDCNDCHGGDHDVVFDHWEDGSTERQRAVVAQDSGVSVGAYYLFVPPPTT
jgi:hypothetical protein